MKTKQIKGKVDILLVEEVDFGFQEATEGWQFLSRLSELKEDQAELLVEPDDISDVEDHRYKKVYIDYIDSEKAFSDAYSSFQSLLEANGVLNENRCPEFPYFGANYPDARCVDGFLWDMDKCDDLGRLYGGGEEPCPLCNTESFFKHHHDPWSGITNDLIVKRVTKLKQEYHFAEEIFNPETTLIFIKS